MFEKILYALTCIVNLFHFGNREAIQVFACLYSGCVSLVVIYIVYIYFYIGFHF